MAIEVCAMEHKTPNHQKGITLIELILVIGIILIFFSVSYLFLRPNVLRAKGRDEKRISDVATLDRAINEFLIDNGFYPDFEDVVRVSTSLPAGNGGPLENVSSGWIDQDLSSYLSKLPTDPVNDAEYFYSYMHTGSVYEINAKLEYLNEYELNSYDGGDDDSVYEAGNDLTVL